MVEVDSMTIKILVTGGTFDKEYKETTGELVFDNTHIPDLLKLGKCTVPVEVHTLMMIDSLQMTEGHRKTLYEKCVNSSEDAIVITHGTDTMALTAQYLGERLKDKTVVLTGALIPLAFGSSDGFFNLGSALAFAQALPLGVYVVMNGRYFNYDNVRKNKRTGEFEELD